MSDERQPKYFDMRKTWGLAEKQAPAKQSENRSIGSK
jgi:hypothetical protein